jgi:hypothetical protein
VGIAHHITLPTKTTRETSTKKISHCQLLQVSFFVSLYHHSFFV